MALEKSLWQRLRNGADKLREAGYWVDLRRIENTCEKGTPDVEGCIDGAQVWIELKSCKRPARASTPCHPKIRDEQVEWLKNRAECGCNSVWLLIQVGEAHKACLYLIPGHLAARAIDVPESSLETLATCSPHLSPAEILLRAARGW